MGSLQANEMANLADLDTALTWHLQCNHYPPIPTYMVEPCKQAIEACNNGEWDYLIDLPNGTTYRGEESVRACVIVEALHLEPWIGPEDED
jgi:hypothetical protein